MSYALKMMNFAFKMMNFALKMSNFAGIPEGKACEYKEVFDEIFKRNAQTLIYRGYSDDPRNTDEAWVETSVWHVHCPQVCSYYWWYLFIIGGIINCYHLSSIIYY